MEGFCSCDVEVVLVRWVGTHTGRGCGVRVFKHGLRDVGLCKVVLATEIQIVRVTQVNMFVCGRSLVAVSVSVIGVGCAAHR